MADITSSLTIKGRHLMVDRPWSWHVWEVSGPTNGVANGDTFLLPDMFYANTVILDQRTQVLAVADATTLTLTMRQGRTVRSTGVFTNISNFFTGFDLQVAKNYAVQGGGASTLADMALDSQIIADTAYGQIQGVFAKTGTGTAANFRFLWAALMGRMDY